jgi:ribosomal protein L34E
MSDTRKTKRDYVRFPSGKSDIARRTKKRQLDLCNGLCALGFWVCFRTDPLAANDRWR